MCLNRQVTQTQQWFLIMSKRKSYEWKSNEKIKMNQEVIKTLLIFCNLLAFWGRKIFTLHLQTEIFSKCVPVLLFLYIHNETKHVKKCALKDTLA